MKQLVVAILFAIFLVAGCVGKPSKPEAPETLKVSSAFPPGGKIPTRYTKDGQDISPYFKIEGIPPKTKSLAVVVDDPDAPGVFTHWLIWNIPPYAEIPGNAPKKGQIQTGPFKGAVQGRNDYGDLGYGGPKPPRGETHRYQFKVYALDSKLPLKPGASEQKLLNSVSKHVLAKGTLEGKYK